MQISTIGVDLAKSVFQVHGVDAAGEVVIRRKLRRSQVCPSSPRSSRALWAWKPAPRRITGRASSPRSATTCG